MVVGLDWLRQLFTDTEVLWLIVGAPKDLDLLQGSKSQMDLSNINPVDPKNWPRSWSA